MGSRLRRSVPNLTAVVGTLRWQGRMSAFPRRSRRTSSCDQKRTNPLALDEKRRTGALVGVNYLGRRVRVLQE